MLTIGDIIRQLSANASAIRALAQTITEEQALWKPNPDAWSMKKVLEHLYNEERIDFRMHLNDMLSDPPRPWTAFNPLGYLTPATCREALEGFLSERDASIAWLSELNAPDWDLTTQATFPPDPEIYTLSAGDVLASWVEHDFLHLRQMIEILYAWNEHQAQPHSVQYAGGW